MLVFSALGYSSRSFFFVFMRYFFKLFFLLFEGFAVSIVPVLSPMNGVLKAFPEQDLSFLFFTLPCHKRQGSVHSILLFKRKGRCLFFIA